jgi:hypothetical protein
MDFASIAKTARELTIVTREPLKTIGLDFEASNIKLVDYTQGNRMLASVENVEM